MSTTKLVRIIFFVLASLFLLVIPYYCHAQLVAAKFKDIRTPVILDLKNYKVDTLAYENPSDTLYYIKSLGVFKIIEKYTELYLTTEKYEKNRKTDTIPLRR